MKTPVLFFAALLLLPLMGFSQFTDVINNQINFEFETRTSGFTGPPDGSPPSEPTVSHRIKLSGGSWNNYNCVNWQGAPPTYNYTNSLVLWGTGWQFEQKYQVESRMWESDAAPHCTYDASVDDHYYNALGTLRGGVTEQYIVYPHAAFRPVSWIGQLGENGSFNLHPNSTKWYGSLQMTWRYHHGDSFNDPLNFGTINDGETKRDINSNEDAPIGTTIPSDLAYSNQSAHSSNDVFYQFTLQKSATVVISTVNSTTDYDSYLALYKQSGTLLFFNNNHTGNQAQITMDLCPGTYIVKVEGQGSAQGLFELTIDVTDLPDLAVTVDNDGVSCPGESDAVLTSNPTGGITSYSYEWFRNSVSIANAWQVTGQSMGPSYEIVITDNCGATVSSGPLSVPNGDNIDPVANCTNADISLIVSSSQTASLTVADINNGSTDNCGIDYMELSQEVFTIASPANSSTTLRVFDDNQNMGTCTVNVNVVNVTSVDDLEANSGFHLYPNPTTNGEFTLDLQIQDLPPGSRVVIRNLLGQTVYTTAARTGTQPIRPDHLPPGIYLVNLEADRTLASKRLVVR